MFRYLLAIILIGISITGFFMFTNPLYNDPVTGIKALQAQVASYNEALDNSKALENERDKLTAKESAISPENLVKIQKLLPDNVDNIRLILELQKIALPYGMNLKNVKYNTTNATTATTAATAATTTTTTATATATTPASTTKTIQGGGGQISQALNKDYGSWDLEFSTTGTYNNFVNFTKDLESNLRIVDISSIQFSSSSGSQAGSSLSEVYTFNFKIKTYWLKN